MERKAAHMDLEAEEKRYADAQREAREKLMAALAPRAPCCYAIAVSGSGSAHPYEDQASALGKAIADAGYDLLTGGLEGVMFDVTKGFLGTDSRSKVVGIIPHGKQDKASDVKVALKKALKKEALPNFQRVQTNLPGRLLDGKTKDHSGPSSRNRVLISQASKVVLMPGGDGSVAEAKLASDYGKQVIAYDPAKGRGGRDGFEKWRQTIAKLKIDDVQSLPEVERWLGKAPEPPKP
jgi:predicted Rossmann-fold nucleotide-binding protein